MISKQGQQYYWIKISNGQRKIQNGRIEDLNRGSAVTRSLDQLIKFDEDVRNELCGSSTAVVTGDGILLPPFPVQPDVGLIQEYLEAIFRIQRAVHSASVVSLLQKNTDTTAQDVFQPLMYIQYLLPGMQDDPSFLTLSRIGGLLKKTVPNVCNGWWVIWWFRLEHVSLTSALSSRLNKYPQVEFKLFVSNSCAESFEDEPSSGQELVTHQLCDISEDHSAFHGSYRLPSESVGLFSASLEFRNMGILPSVLGTTRVAVECSCVPHDIFKAACEAAQDQNKSERRRRQAPMLATILDGDESLVVDVKPWSLQTEPEEEQNMKKKSLPESENRARLVDDPSFIATLQRERDTLQCALEKANENLKEANKKLRMVESERRVWQMSKEEIFRQISLLIENAAKDKEEKKNLAGSLKEAENEIGELRRQLNFQETKVSNRGRSIEHGEVVRGVQAEITDMALVLEELTSELQEKNRAIEGLHRKCLNSKTIKILFQRNYRDL